MSEVTKAIIIFFLKWLGLTAGTSVLAWAQMEYWLGWGWPWWMYVPVLALLSGVVVAQVADEDD